MKYFQFQSWEYSIQFVKLIWKIFTPQITSFQIYFQFVSVILKKDLVRSIVS